MKTIDRLGFELHKADYPQFWVLPHWQWKKARKQLIEIANLDSKAEAFIGKKYFIFLGCQVWSEQ